MSCSFPCCLFYFILETFKEDPLCVRQHALVTPTYIVWFNLFFPWICSLNHHRTLSVCWVWDGGSPRGSSGETLWSLGGTPTFMGDPVYKSVATLIFICKLVKILTAYWQQCFKIKDESSLGSFNMSLFLFLFKSLCLLTCIVGE